MKSLVIVYSYHHHNTEKIARVMAKVLNAPVKTPLEINPAEVQNYDLVGFGSGIYGAQHDISMIDLADGLPKVDKKNAFIFSTSAIINPDKIKDDHSLLREKLQAKGYTILDEFSCKGFNTNSFMKYFGGMNKGRPNVEDLDNAKNFVLQLSGKSY